MQVVKSQACCQSFGSREIELTLVHFEELAVCAGDVQNDWFFYHVNNKEGTHHTFCNYALSQKPVDHYDTLLAEGPIADVWADMTDQGPDSQGEFLA